MMLLMSFLIWQGKGGRERTYHSLSSGTVLADSLTHHFVLFLNEELGTQ